jgi:hypothetical protein
VEGGGDDDREDGEAIEKTVKEVRTVHASVGDRIVIKGHHVGEPDRDAEIIEVRGPDGSPPYVVRWSEDGHEGLFFPGSDAVVQHFAH